MKTVIRTTKKVLMSFVSFLLMGAFLGWYVTWLILPGSYKEAPPYQDVEVFNVEANDEKIYADISFKKTGCDFSKLEVKHRLVNSDDDLSHLRWVNTEGFRGNRPEGEHVLNLVIDKDWDPETHDIRDVFIITTHWCNSEEVRNTPLEVVGASNVLIPVTKVMAHFRVNGGVYIEVCYENDCDGGITTLREGQIILGNEIPAIEQERSK